MSLILDALKKAEQDRQVGQAPSMDEMLVRAKPAVPRRRGQQDAVMLVTVAIVALLFVVAGLVSWFWPKPETAAGSTVSIAAQPTAAEPAPTLRIDPERLEAPIGDTAASEAETMDELDGEAPTAKLPPSQPAPPARTAAPAPTAPSMVIGSVEPAPVAAPPPAAEPDIRALKEMPPAFRGEFPKLTVDVHVYDANPLRRFVLINGKKYRETDTLVDGPRIIEIGPNGVVVEHRGSKVLVELPR